MDLPDERDQRIRELEERLSLLSQASLRVNESLDFDTVLQGVLDSARSLTGARYGVIALHDAAGNAGDFLSSGMTADEAERVWQIPGWAEHFRYLAGLPVPLRVADLLGHIRSLGLPEMEPPLELSPSVSFLAAPVLHLGERVGSVFLAEKEGGREFTPEDEDTLVMFAAQAAMAIANARRHREEQRARAGLETLIDTSPVGVAVFDAVTGAPTSFNREATRIVDGLLGPGQSPVDLLDVLTMRRADGREFSLQEFPLAGLLSVEETVHAEEIVLRVPDGRSVTVLLNATPIMGEDGAVESVVVAMQDLAGVEELERLRAEFLAMVSHELRGPLTSIKGSAATVLESAADLDPAVVRQFFQIIGDQANHMNELVSDLLDVAGIETGTLAVSPEPAEVAVLVDRARSAFGSSGGRNSLTIDLEPDLPLVLADRRRIVQVLGQPAVQRGAALAGGFGDPAERGAGGGVRGGVGGGRGAGHTGGAAAGPVPEVHAAAVRGAGWRHGVGAGHLQGDRGGPRGPHPGRERRAGSGSQVHLHPACGGDRRQRPGVCGFGPLVAAGTG